MVIHSVFAFRVCNRLDLVSVEKSDERVREKTSRAQKGGVADGNKDEDEDEDEDEARSSPSRTGLRSVCQVFDSRTNNQSLCCRVVTSWISARKTL